MELEVARDPSLHSAGGVPLVLPAISGPRSTLPQRLRGTELPVVVPALPLLRRAVPPSPRGFATPRQAPSQRVSLPVPPGAAQDQVEQTETSPSGSDVSAASTRALLRTRRSQGRPVAIAMLRWVFTESPARGATTTTGAAIGRGPGVEGGGGGGAASSGGRREDHAWTRLRRQAKWSMIEGLLAADVIVIVFAAGHTEDKSYYMFVGYFALLLLVASFRVCCAFALLLPRAHWLSPPLASQVVHQELSLSQRESRYIVYWFPSISTLLVSTNSAAMVHLVCFVLFSLLRGSLRGACMAALFSCVPLIVACWSLCKNMAFACELRRPPQPVPGEFFGAGVGVGSVAALNGVDASSGDARQKRRMHDLVELWQGARFYVYSDLRGRATCDSTCLICLEEFTLSDEIIMMPCKHFFHDACARHWLQREPRCPLRCKLCP